MSLNRLFTFGCSFTNYRWSTWADCLAPEFDYFENWGQAGGGNHYIFNSIMEADQRHDFKNNDTVVVCWSSILREDRYTDNWQTHGNIATCEYYDKKYFDKYITERGCLIRDMAFIKATLNFLQNKQGVKWVFLSMAPLLLADQFGHSINLDSDVQELYKNVLENIKPSFYETVLRSDWEQGWTTNRIDIHPTPVEHLEYLDTVLPSWVTNQSTRVKMYEETQNLKKFPHKSGMTTIKRL
jgi:hypothetical protein